MSKESKELHDYQIRCAEQESLIELLEKEVKRLNLSLKLAKDRNRRLTTMLVGPNPFTEKPVHPASDTQGGEEKNVEPNIPSNTTEGNSSEDSNSGENQDKEEEPFDIDKFSPPGNEISPHKFKSYKEQITFECREFLKNYSFPDFYKEIAKDIIGQENGLTKLLAVIYNYIRTLSLGERPEKCNTVILTAPSGNGKSALFKSLAAFFETTISSLVCSRKDASRLVPSGYRGTTVNTVMSDFLSHDEYIDEQRYGFL